MTPWDLGRGRKSAGTCGQTRRHLSQAHVAGDWGSKLRVHEPEPESPGTAGRYRGPTDTGTGHPGTAGLHHGTSGTSPGRPGELVDPSGRQTWAQVIQDSWSTHEYSDPGLSHLEQLVEPAGTRKWARVVRDSWSTQWASDPGPSWLGELVNTAGLGPGPDWPGAAGKNRKPSDPGPDHPRELSICGHSD